MIRLSLVVHGVRGNTPSEELLARLSVPRVEPSNSLPMSPIMQSYLICHVPSGEPQVV